MKMPTSQNTTSAAIVRWYEKRTQEHRPHLGCSILGHACARYIWMTWRWAKTPTFPGRVLRLFNTGLREETRLLEELRGIGATVWPTDPASGTQWRVKACAGHVGGSLDGVAQGLPEAPKTPAVLEFKTHSHKSYTDLIAKGVQGAKPQHYDQMNLYMGLIELERALYMAVDKDTDDVYTEWVHFDKARFDQLILKAEALIEASEPPPRISDDPAHWQCKFCNFHAVCHGEIAAEANCRTCAHATPEMDGDGRWSCALKEKDLTVDDQLAGCTMHLMIPALVPYAEPVDGGNNWVQYKHKANGREFVNGHGRQMGDMPMFTSQELQHCPAALLDGIAEIKEVFVDAKVVKPSVLDIVSDDPDQIPIKPEPIKQRQGRRKIKAALEAFKP